MGGADCPALLTVDVAAQLQLELVGLLRRHRLQDGADHPEWIGVNVLVRRDEWAQYLLIRPQK